MLLKKLPNTNKTKKEKKIVTIWSHNKFFFPSTDASYSDLFFHWSAPKFIANIKTSKHDINAIKNHRGGA